MAESSKLTVNTVTGITQLNVPVWNSADEANSYLTPELGFVIVSNGSLLYWDGSRWTSF